jgi:hypothetical protein
MDKEPLEEKKCLFVTFFSLSLLEPISISRLLRGWNGPPSQRLFSSVGRDFLSLSLSLCLAHFSVFLSVLLLTGMVAVILVRILRYDVGSQIQFDRDDVQEETGVFFLFFCFVSTSVYFFSLFYSSVSVFLYCYLLSSLSRSGSLPLSSLSLSQSLSLSLSLSFSLSLSL